MTYFESKGYRFTLLDIDIDEFSDEYVENYIKENKFDFVLTGTRNQRAERLGRMVTPPLYHHLSKSLFNRVLNR